MVHRGVPDRSGLSLNDPNPHSAESSSRPRCISKTRSNALCDRDVWNPRSPRAPRGYGLPTATVSVALELVTRFRIGPFAHRHFARNSRSMQCHVDLSHRISARFERPAKPCGQCPGSLRSDPLASIDLGDDRNARHVSRTIGLVVGFVLGSQFDARSGDRCCNRSGNRGDAWDRLPLPTDRAGLGTTLGWQ